MLPNLVLILAAAVASSVLSTLFALAGGDVSPQLLVLSFAWGTFAALVALRRHGSAAAVWERLQRPPR